MTTPTSGSPADIALRYLRDHRERLGLTGADLEDLAVTGAYRSAHSGVSHVFLRQRVGGIEVSGADASFNIVADGRILSFRSSLFPHLAAAVNPASPGRGAADAALAAARHAGLGPTRSPSTREQKGGPAQETLLDDGGVASSPIAAKLVYQPVGPREVRLAWQVDIEEKSGRHLWRMTVDTESGEVLNQEDYTAHDDWGAPLAAGADAAGIASVASALASPNPVVDGSSYRVFALPSESPNDGPRTLVTNPADAIASPFGWHDTDGVAGAEFTITRGNNAHAYLDQDNNNAPDAGTETDGGSSLNFDFPADLNEHPQNYRDAAAANLFYWVNIMHDVMYRYGFDEPSGNFQANNYGRGGGEGDYIRAEIQDGGGTNNANFATPAADGGAPRMQMFVWTGGQFGAQNQVIVDGVGSFNASWARFSPAPSVAGTSGQIIDAGSGCAPADYATAPLGDWIAIVTGGNAGCMNIDKARQAGAAGAQALIVAHDTSAAPPILTGSLTTPPPTIPVASISLADGDAIRAALAAGSVTGTVRKHPDHPGMREGSFDAGVIIHEYALGVANRLTGGPGINCLVGQESMLLGWGDWYAIALTARPSDNGAQPRGLGTYVLFEPDRQSPGIRPRPYSTDLSINPVTYDSIKTGGWVDGTSLTIPHGVGFAWASMLWEVFWGLVEKHGFNPNVYEPWHTGGNNLAIQLVTDGLKLQGCNPGFVTGRDAILLADQILSGGANQCRLWRSFAKRGLGLNAIQGTLNRDDNTEAFDVLLECQASASVHPASLASSQVAGTTVTQMIEISNTGGADSADLDWTISTAASDCSAPSVLPWVSALPASGTAAAQSSSTVSVTFDSTGLAIGSHTGKLCIASSGPHTATPLVEVPLELRVIYQTSEFGPPLSSAGTNVATAGSVVPVKFSLGGDFGTDIFAPGFPASRPVNCSTQAPLGPLVPAQSPGSGGLNFDAATGQYNFRWKTEKEWRGSCRELVVGLNDGTEHSVLFSFR